MPKRYLPTEIPIRFLNLETLDPKVVVFEECARAWTKEEGVIHMPAMRAAQDVDPVGAGDGFDSGFLFHWLAGKSGNESPAAGAYVGAKAVEVISDYAGYPQTIDA